MTKPIRLSVVDYRYV